MDGQIRDIHNIVQKHNLCPKNTKSEWLEIICYMREKNWLYFIVENDQLKGVLGAYRIEEYNEHTEDSLPTEEKGNILYVPFACSESKDRLVWLKMLRGYLKDHDIKKVVFNERKKNNRFRRIICNKHKN